MAASFVENARVTFVRKNDDGALVFTGNLHPDICVGVLPFGGYLLSVVITAVQEAVKSTSLKDILHLTAYFLKAGEIGPCEVHVRFMRSGKAFHNVEVALFQAGETRITAHALVGTLTDACFDPKTAPPLTLTPANSIYRRTPVALHPSNVQTVELPFFLRFGKGLRCAPDPSYSERNARKFNTPNDGTSLEQNGVLEYAALLELTHPSDELNAVTIPVLADMFRSTPVLVDIAEGKMGISDPTKLSWFPTMVLSIEFKHRIPQGTSFSTRTGAIYSQSRFLTAGRHDVTVEIWTAPPGELGKRDGSTVVEKDWREKMVCVAVATQMALTMGAASNTKRGKARSDDEVKGKL